MVVYSESESSLSLQRNIEAAIFDQNTGVGACQQTPYVTRAICDPLPHSVATIETQELQVVLAKNGLRSDFRASSKNFPGGACPQTPLDTAYDHRTLATPLLATALVCVCMCVCVGWGGTLF